MTAEAARILGHYPRLATHGPLDDVPDHIAHHLVAVLREALSNVARHAEATATTISLHADDRHVRLIVDDDGCGLPEQLTPGNGITNIHARATALAGAANLSSRPDGGTRLKWSCPRVAATPT